MRGWSFEPTGLEVRPVVADLGFRSPPSSVAIGGTLMSPNSSADVEVEVAGIVSLSLATRSCVRRAGAQLGAKARPKLGTSSPGR